MYDYKEVEIVKAKLCPDHMHMPVKILSKISVLFMGYLKGKSSLMIFEQKNTMICLLVSKSVKDYWQTKKATRW